MSWGPTENGHEGWMASTFADGALGSGAGLEPGTVLVCHLGTRELEWSDRQQRPEAEITGWVPACSCGWRGRPWTRVTATDRRPAAPRWSGPDHYVEDDAPGQAGRQEWLAHARPQEALARITWLAAETNMLGQRLDDAVSAARSAGAKWEQIGAAAGITRQAAWERWRDLRTADTSPTASPTASFAAATRNAEPGQPAYTAWLAEQVRRLGAEVSTTLGPVLDTLWFETGLDSTTGIRPPEFARKMSRLDVATLLLDAAHDTNYLLAGIATAIQPDDPDRAADRIADRSTAGEDGASPLQGPTFFDRNRRLALLDDIAERAERIAGTVRRVLAAENDPAQLGAYTNETKQLAYDQQAIIDRAQLQVAEPDQGRTFTVHLAAAPDRDPQAGYTVWRADTDDPAGQLAAEQLAAAPDAEAHLAIQAALMQLGAALTRGLPDPAKNAEDAENDAENQER